MVFINRRWYSATSFAKLVLIKDAAIVKISPAVRERTIRISYSDANSECHCVDFRTCQWKRNFTSQEEEALR